MNDKLDILKETGAFLEGHFLLSSGRHSNAYCQMAKLQQYPDKTVLALLDAWTDEIAQGLAGMVHIFNPQLILIGGGVSAQQKLLIEPIAEKVKASVMPAFAEGLEIRAAQLHNDAGMVGAVYYFRQTMEKE